MNEDQEKQSKEVSIRKEDPPQDIAGLYAINQLSELHNELLAHFNKVIEHE